MGELIFNAVLLVFMIVMTFVSGSIQIWDGIVGARVYPMVILFLIDLLLLLKTVKIFRALPKEERHLDLSFFKEKSVQRLLIAFVLTFLYVFFLEKLGFVIMTFLYGMGMCILLGCRKAWLVPVISLSITLVLYAIFAWGLDTMLPRGSGKLYYFGLWLETLL